MKRITTIIPTTIPDPGAVAKLAEQGYSPDSLLTAIEQAQKLASDPKATADDVAMARAMVDKLTSMLPAEIPYDQTDVQIVYEERDRVVVAVHAGQVGATLITKDGDIWFTELDSAPGVTVKLGEAAFVRQAMTPGDGTVTYVTPIPTGWLKPPGRADVMKMGSKLRFCPICESGLLPGDEAAKKCSTCGRVIQGVYTVGLEAL